MAGGLKRRNTLRFQVAAAERGKVNLRYIVVTVFKECFAVGVEKMFCVQDYQSRGLFDVTLESEGLCLEVFEQYKERKEEGVLQGISMEPLFSNNIKLVTLLMYNPFVTAREVEVFLGRYCTVLRPEERLLNSFGVWNGRRQLLVRLRPEQDSVGGVRHLPAVFSIGPDKGFLTYAGLPTYCRRCLKYGHMSRDCTQFVCLACGEEGHAARECPGGRKCHLCGSGEHLVRDCPARRRSYAEAAGGQTAPPGGQEEEQQRDPSGGQEEEQQRDREKASDAAGAPPSGAAVAVSAGAPGTTPAASVAGEEAVQAAAPSGQEASSSAGGTELQVAAEGEDVVLEVSTKRGRNTSWAEALEETQAESLCQENGSPTMVKRKKKRVPAKTRDLETDPEHSMDMGSGASQVGGGGNMPSPLSESGYDAGPVDQGAQNEVPFLFEEGGNSEGV